MDGLDHGEHYAPTPGLDMVLSAGQPCVGFHTSGRVVTEAGRPTPAYFHAKSADDTNIELPDNFDARTRRGSVASSNGACMDAPDCQGVTARVWKPGSRRRT